MNMEISIMTSFTGTLIVVIEYDKFYGNIVSSYRFSVISLCSTLQAMEQNESLHELHGGLGWRANTSLPLDINDCNYNSTYKDEYVNMKYCMNTTTFPLILAIGRWCTTNLFIVTEWLFWLLYKIHSPNTHKHINYY